MKLAIHQPNFLPWPGYYLKIHQADAMVHLDTAQHVRNDFDHRNWVKDPSGAKQWLRVHLAGSNPSIQPVNKVRLADDHWRQNLENVLYNNYHRAPHYQPYADRLLAIIHREWPSLVDLCLALTESILKELAITTPCSRLSEYDQKLGRRTERLVNICRQLGADTYLSGIGGRTYLDEDLFRQAGINVEYQDYRPVKYPQIHGPFVPNLSIVDLLFNTGPQARDYLLGGNVVQ